MTTSPGSMDPARFELVREIFLAARHLNGSARESELNARCGGDEVLKSDVRELLDAHDEPEDSGSHAIDRPLAGQQLARLAAAAFNKESEAEEELPARIGAFSVVRLLGEGGMGRVYEARQSKPDRRVAVKVLKSGSATREAAKRFEREAELLAKLQHPGIAQVYEVGVFTPEEGSRRAEQYFAMEFVEGSTLTKFAREHELSVEERLGLMAAICDAVEHAHLRGVIHRDLKPANILVEESDPPRPKILDFGVARSAEADAVMSMQTQAGQIVGTLAYMSPEQVAGSPLVNARTDVYALGVMLYELLTRRLPHNISVTSIAEAARAIQHDDPARPSSIDHTLRGDLETIVLKAIERDPARRYGSAAALATDIRNFMADKPIMARPPTNAYLFAKFARRHTGLVAGATAAVVALIAGLAVSLVLYGQAEKARQTASEQLTISKAAQARAEGINTFLVQDLIDATLAHDDARNTTLHDALVHAADRIESRFANDAVTRSGLQMQVGSMLSRFGDEEKARDMLLPAWHEVEGRLAPESDEAIDAKYRYALAVSRCTQHKEALALFEELVQVSTKKYGMGHLNTMKMLSSKGNSQQALGDFDGGLASLKQVIETMRGRTTLAEKEALSTALELTAAVHFTQKKPLEAEPYLRAALGVFDPKERALSASVIMNSYMIANVYVNSQRMAEGSKVLDQILPAAERAFGEESAEAGAIRLLRGRCHAEAGENDKADEMLTRGYAIIEKRYGKKRYDTERANGLLRMFYGKIGNDQKLEVTIRRAIELRENVENNPEHDSVLNVKAEYAEFLLKRGRKDEARVVIGPVLPIAQRVLAIDHEARQRIEKVAAECGVR